MGANPAAAETRAAQPFRVRFVSVDGPLQVEELDFESKRHGAMALEVLHGALTRPKERTDDLLFAAARAPSLNVVKSQNGATCATTQGEGLVVVTIVNESDQYKTAAVVCYCKSAQARSVDGVLENVKDRADAYYERLKALTPKPDPRAPPQRGPRFPAKWKAFVATADLPPRSRRVALAVVRSGSQYELGDIDCAFMMRRRPPKGPAAHRRLRRGVEVAHGVGCGRFVRGGGAARGLHGSRARRRR